MNQYKQMFEVRQALQNKPQIEKSSVSFGVNQRTFLAPSYNIDRVFTEKGDFSSKDIGSFSVTLAFINKDAKIEEVKDTYNHLISEIPERAFSVRKVLDVKDTTPSGILVQTQGIGRFTIQEFIVEEISGVKTLSAKGYLLSLLSQKHGVYIFAIKFLLITFLSFMYSL